MLEFMNTTPLLSSDAACDCHSKQTNTEQSTLHLEKDKLEIDKKIRYVDSRIIALTCLDGDPGPNVHVECCRVHKIPDCDHNVYFHTI